METDSGNCLSCHDGLISEDISLGHSALLANDTSGEHPVNVAYETSPQRREQKMLRPAAAIDPRLQLDNGRITCTTCHSPYSTEKSLLVMSNEYSRMCTSCHQMN